ncbi:MAG: alpha/beta fold hydrolase [Gammaproteobacteria bacterium]|nr:alpha/beta fold hydrolase [Gammaproteobacteria bacterium]MCP5425039.1 alpha/beta fold hydrolase [Gammaproteobacteria bacterium]MCP5459742.1 alpha/beta fold hydrolase [Gammaproteobacteria bacterium]
MSISDLFSSLDDPLVNSFIFFPRPDPGTPPPNGSEDLDIPVAAGVTVAARYHPAELWAPTILYFHGNGEIVADYDPVAPYYRKAGASFVCVDYRGYGRSSGYPSVKSLIEDAHRVLDAVRAHLARRQHRGPLVIMGRSLGSAPAIELAATHGAEIDGLILESGFANTPDLLEHLGMPAEHLKDSMLGEDNEDKMLRVTVPLLVLHAEYDEIVPSWHGRVNYERAASTNKQLVMIPDADHNTIMMVGGPDYWHAIGDFLNRLDV